MADVQHFEIFVALQLAELHEAAWAFGDDNVCASGFEIFVFIVEHLGRGGWEIDLEGAGAAAAHGGIFSWQEGDGFFQQGLRFFVDALTGMRWAGS